MSVAELPMNRKAIRPGRIITWTLLLIERARLYQQQGKFEEARNDLRKALDLATNNNETGRRTEILDMLGRLATQAAATAAPGSSATPG